MTFYITFRLDDVVPKMDWQKFDLFRELFNKYKICPLIGVVPDNQDEQLNVGNNNSFFWELLRSLKKDGWLLAQHGYKHVYSTQNSGLLGINAKSEFAGLSYKEQWGKINRGKNILQEQGLVSDIWMAPAHSFDVITLRALVDSGFKFISDGYSLFPYTKNGLKFIPCQFSFPRNLFFYGIGTVCIHPNTASLDYIKKLELFLEYHLDSCVSYSVALDMKVVNNAANMFIERYYLILRKILSFR